jgi:hypothetical protein
MAALDNASPRAGLVSSGARASSGALAPKKGIAIIPPPPLEGGRCETFLAAAPAGSHMRKELEDDYAEACTFIEFLGTFPLSFECSNEAHGVVWLDVQHVDIRHATFAAIGKSRCQSMRHAFSRLTKYLGADADKMIAGGLSVVVLQLFFNEILNQGRAWASARHLDSKDTACASVHSSLKTFARYTGLNFLALDDPSILKTIPAPRRAEAEPSASATIAIAAQAHLEHLAKFHPNPRVRHYAGCAALCGILSLRGVEILRCRFMSSPEFVLGDVSPMLWLRCMAGKSSSRQKAQPFDAFAPTVGFLGDASDWMDKMYDFVMGTTGLNCMVPDFTSPSGDSVAVSDGWLLSQPMSPERWALVVAQLLALEPYGASKESLIASGFNIHAFHGLLSCIIRSFLSETAARRFSEVDFYEAGRWSTGAGSGPKPLLKPGSMPLRYSGGSTAAEVEYSLRLRVLRIVSNFIGDSDWRETLPFQVGEIPSYGFLHGSDTLLSTASVVRNAASVASERRAPPGGSFSSAARSAAVDEPPAACQPSASQASSLDPAAVEPPASQRTSLPASPDAPVAKKQRTGGELSFSASAPASASSASPPSSSASSQDADEIDEPTKGLRPGLRSWNPSAFLRAATPRAPATAPPPSRKRPAR